MTNEEVRKASGEFQSTDQLTLFFYLLMRDHITPGTVEQIVIDVEKCNQPANYTNGWLAQYAFNLASRIDNEIQINKDVLDASVYAMEDAVNKMSKYSIDKIIDDCSKKLFIGGVMDGKRIKVDKRLPKTFEIPAIGFPGLHSFIYTKKIIKVNDVEFVFYIDDPKMELHEIFAELLRKYKGEKFQKVDKENCDSTKYVYLTDDVIDDLFHKHSVAKNNYIMHKKQFRHACKEIIDGFNGEDIESSDWDIKTDNDILSNGFLVKAIQDSMKNLFKKPPEKLEDHNCCEWVSALHRKDGEIIYDLYPNINKLHCYAITHCPWCGVKLK